MKAAVIYPGHAWPIYTDVPEPVSRGKDEEMITVKAVAIKHFDKGRASGHHYSADAPKEIGRIIGGDGVGLLADGTRVYGMSGDGMLSEKAMVEKDRIVKVPDELSDAVAAALPNAVIGAAMALRFKADMQKGDTVLINGATGFTGRVAVQIAKYYGAGKLIVTGRDQQSLAELQQLGADEIISVLQDDNDFIHQLKSIHTGTPINVVIDYLWGHTAELIFSVLKGDGRFTQRTRFVSVGSVTGDLLQLSAANLRSLDIQLTGSGLGAWSKAQVKIFFNEILPEMYGLAAQGRLQVETAQVALRDIADSWNLKLPGGRRLVVTI